MRRQVKWRKKKRETEIESGAQRERERETERQNESESEIFSSEATKEDGVGVAFFGKRGVR